MKNAQKVDDDWDSGRIDLLDDTQPMSIREGLRRFKRITSECEKNVEVLTKSIAEAHAADRAHDRALQKIEAHMAAQDRAAADRADSDKWLKRYIIGSLVAIIGSIFSVGVVYSQIGFNTATIKEIRADMKTNDMRMLEFFSTKWPRFETRIDSLGMRLDILSDQLSKQGKGP